MHLILKISDVKTNLKFVCLSDITKPREERGKIFDDMQNTWDLLVMNEKLFIIKDAHTTSGVKRHFNKKNKNMSGFAWWSTKTFIHSCKFIFGKFKATHLRTKIKILLAFLRNQSQRYFKENTTKKDFCPFICL